MIGSYLICILTVPLEIKNVGVVWTQFSGSCAVAASDQVKIPHGEPLHLYMDCTEELGFLTAPNQIYKSRLKFWTRLGDDCEEI